MASWFRYVEYGIPAARLLHDKGLGHYAAPIRRSIIEHAVNMTAIAEEPEGFDSVIRASQKSTKRLKEALTAVRLEPGEDLEQFLTLETDDATKKLDVKAKIKHRCDSLGESGKLLYISWLQETALSHANVPTALIFLHDTPGDDWPTLALEPQIPAQGWTSDMDMADAFIMSLDAFSQVVEGDPFRSDVERLNRKKDALMDKAKQIGAGADLDPPLFSR